MLTKISRILRRAFMYLTDGRPMRLLGYAFRDEVSGHPIFYYSDHKNRVWMAETPWSHARARSHWRAVEHFDAQTVPFETPLRPFPREDEDY